MTSNEIDSKTIFIISNQFNKLNETWTDGEDDHIHLVLPKIHNVFCLNEMNIAKKMHEMKREERMEKKHTHTHLSDS